MASKITPQQRDELRASHGRPVPVEDDEAQKLYFLVDANYLHASQEQLKALIQAGIDAAHIPAAEAEVDLRRYADNLANPSA
jgi:hypothetical protein